MKMKRVTMQGKDLQEHGRIILAHGEVTGHRHEVIGVGGEPIPFPRAQFFEEPDGRRVLLIEHVCELRHPEHGIITLDPADPQQFRQGDVFLNPIAPGAWEVIRQREYAPDAIREVAD